MAHVYASLPALKNFIRDGGATALGTTNDTRMLGILEAVSRVIDRYCNRSRFGSGFGPRTGTNRYDGQGGLELALYDDLLSATTVTIRATTGSATTQAPVVETDYYYGSDTAPFRDIALNGLGISSFGSGRRVTEVAGSWGYQDVRVVSTTTVASGLASDAAATTFVTSDSPTIELGQTLFIGTEQLYVSGLSGTTATVVRGANGTTAAVHANASAISVYVYPPEVVDVCLRLSLKRWKARDAGADGSDGGGEVLSITPRESEDTILRRGIGHLRFIAVG